jgi:hypothetical protein
MKYNAIPALRQFMECYWMETADLVYGNLTGAVQAFVQSEGDSMADRLMEDLDRVQEAGYVVDRLNDFAEEFWMGMGARWIRPDDSKLIKLLVARRN